MRWLIWRRSAERFVLRTVGRLRWTWRGSNGSMVDRAQVRVIHGPEDLSDEELDNLIEGIRRRLEERRSGEP